MNLAEIRELCRVQLGLPDTGSKGRARLNDMINQALRYVGPDLPEALMRRQYRLRLEKAWTTGTLSGVANDPYLLEIIGADAGFTFPEAVEIRARTLEVTLGAEHYHTVRIRDFWQKVELGGPTRYFFILPTPFYNPTATGLVYRVYTDAYPIPITATDIQTVQLSVTSQITPFARPESHSGLLALRRARGWRASGRIQAYADGDAEQVIAPRDVPKAEVAQEPEPTERWGYDSTGTQRGGAYVGHQYGPAGSFEYCFCLGWGRRPFPQDAHAGAIGSSGLSLTAPGESRIGLPFYMGGPSKGTGVVSTTWGGAAVKLTSPNMHYVLGYNARSDALSRGHSGLEKWWFRRRTAKLSAGTAFPQVEADGVWYLWRITDAEETTTWDRGDSDPPDRLFELPRNYGHREIRFDITDPITEDVLLEYQQKPGRLEVDEDVLPIPETHADIILEGVRAQMAMRDGDKQGVALAAQRQRERLQDLINRYQRDSFMSATFGRVAVGSGQPGMWPWPNPPIVGL